MESGTVCVYVTIVSSNDVDDPAAECRARLERAAAAGPEEIVRASRAWWEDYWMRGLAAVGDGAAFDSLPMIDFACPPAESEM